MAFRRSFSPMDMRPFDRMPDIRTFEHPDLDGLWNRLLSDGTLECRDPNEWEKKEKRETALSKKLDWYTPTKGADDHLKSDPNYRTRHQYLAVATDPTIGMDAYYRAIPVATRVVPGTSEITLDLEEPMLTEWRPIRHWSRGTIVDVYFKWAGVEQPEQDVYWVMYDDEVERTKQECYSKHARTLLWSCIFCLIVGIVICSGADLTTR